MEYMTKELKKQTIANKKWEEKNKEYSSYLKRDHQQEAS